jgi:hypothetical protein
MPTRYESCQKQLVDDQKQKMCDENACSNHSRHGHNNIEEGEHLEEQSTMTLFTMFTNELLLKKT